MLKQSEMGDKEECAGICRNMLAKQKTGVRPSDQKSAPETFHHKKLIVNY